MPSCFNSFKTEYLHLLSETKVQRGILVFVGLMNNTMLALFDSYIEEHNKSAFFYMAYDAAKTSGGIERAGSDSLIWAQVHLFPTDRLFFNNYVNFNCLRCHHKSNANFR